MLVFDRPCRRPHGMHVVLALVITILTALFSAGDIRAQGMDKRDMPNMGKEMAAPEGVKQATATGTVTAVNTTGRKITLDHNPIADINWPAMKMEFPVAPSVDLSKMKTGDRVRFTLSGSGSSYTVQSISPGQ
jgi:Cu/Ag efflux protein CusF